MLLRRRLRSAVTAGWAPPGASDDDIEHLLLMFEELTRGREPLRCAVRVSVRSCGAAPITAVSPASIKAW